MVLREHSYDGIQEFDQKLPNWWLYTLYGAIVFSIVYWFILFQANNGQHDINDIENAISDIQAARLAALGSFDDPTLWQMSQNPTLIARGEATYVTHCQACHLASLKGKDEPGGIGENLVDGTWKYGGTPTEVMHIVLKGSPDKASGMQAWESQLGAVASAEVVAYIMSHHTAP